MAVKLTSHAQEALELRGLRLAWIEATVAHPALARPDRRRPGVMLAFARIAEFGGRVLRVAYRPDGADILVITAHFDRGATL